jgi:transcription elongation factor GreA
MAEKRVMTSQGLQQLQDELEDLKINRRKENAQKIKEAREQGDLSENAEYEAAREEQREIEARIAELDELIKNVEIVELDESDLSKVHIGSIVTVYDVEFDEEVEYYIVGTAEADIINNRISNESPVGSALMGHVEGDVVTVHTPGGDCEYKVLSIARKED